MATENGPCEDVSPIVRIGDVNCHVASPDITALGKEGSSVFQTSQGVDVEKFRECTTCILAKDKKLRK